MKLRPSKKQLMFGGIVLLILAVGASIALYLVNASQSDTSSPTFSILLPKDKTATDLGGVSLVSPPEASPVYAYADTIDNVGITVSQQEIPKTFKGGVNKNVEQLAKQDNANRKVDAKGTAVYIGKSAKGPQSVYFVKNDLLILIKSQSEISDAHWIQYIASLTK